MPTDVLKYRGATDSADGLNQSGIYFLTNASLFEGYYGYIFNIMFYNNFKIQFAFAYNINRFAYRTEGAEWKTDW